MTAVCRRLPSSPRARRATAERRARYHFDPATILVVDRGYVDYEWFLRLTRLKDKASFDVVEDRPLPERGRALKNQIIFFHGRAGPERECFFCTVAVWNRYAQIEFPADLNTNETRKSD